MVREVSDSLEPKLLVYRDHCLLTDPPDISVLMPHSFFNFLEHCVKRVVPVRLALHLPTKELALYLRRDLMEQLQSLKKLFVGFTGLGVKVRLPLHEQCKQVVELLVRIPGQQRDVCLLSCFLESCIHEFVEDEGYHFEDAIEFKGAVFVCYLSVELEVLYDNLLVFLSVRE
jgi:hypothetical protein